MFLMHVNGIKEMFFSPSVPAAKLPREKNTVFQTLEYSLRDGPGPPGGQGFGPERRGALRFKQYEPVAELACS